MASNHKLVILSIIAVVLPWTVLAKEIIVGGYSGWTVGFDYQTWASTRDFRVGDKLVFKYPVGVHNVFKVNGTAFQSCTVPPKNEALTSGEDKIVLASPGRKWYICGVGGHCEFGGQKLSITVQPKLPEATIIPYSQSSPLYKPDHSTYGLLLMMAIVLIVSMNKV